MSSSMRAVLLEISNASQSPSHMASRNIMMQERANGAICSLIIIRKGVRRRIVGRTQSRATLPVDQPEKLPVVILC